MSQQTPTTVGPEAPPRLAATPQYLRRPLLLGPVGVDLVGPLNVGLATQCAWHRVNDRYEHASWGAELVSLHIRVTRALAEAYGES